MRLKKAETDQIMKCLSIFVAGAVLVLSGCATEYHARRADGGYSETQTGPQSWQVVFEGTRATMSEQMRDFALLRSAELTLAQGYSHFTLSESSQERRTPQLQAEASTITMYKDKSAAPASAVDAKQVCDAMAVKYDTVCR